MLSLIATCLNIIEPCSLRVGMSPPRVAPLRTMPAFQPLQCKLAPHHLAPFLKHNSFHREQYLAVCLLNFSLDCKDILSSIIPRDSPDSWLLSKLTDFLVRFLSRASYFQPYYTTTSVTPFSFQEFPTCNSIVPMEKFSCDPLLPLS